MSNDNRKKTKSSTPQPASLIALLSGPKVMYDEMGRILIESMVAGNVVQQVLDTNEPIVRRALEAIGWVPPGNNVEKAAYQSVAALIGAGATYQEVVDFLMVKLGLSPDTPEVRASEIKKRIAGEAEERAEGYLEWNNRLEGAIKDAGFTIVLDEMTGAPVKIVKAEG